MTVFFRFIAIIIILGSVSSHSYAEKNLPNFVFGLGYGLLHEKSLMNIDVKINIPVNHYLTTQVLLNSNYFITGSEEDSFAQSELSSNWFVNNDYGRVGLGLGVNEREPLDENKKTDRKMIGSFIGDVFLGDFSLTANYISNDASFNNITSSRMGLGYYIHDDQRISVYREQYGEGNIGLRVETFFQPEKYRRKGSIGIIIRSRKKIDYVGATVQYYFDHSVSLKQREREFH